MDDITIDGPVALEPSYIKIIIDDDSAKGMHLNVTKCELISNDIPPTIVPLDIVNRYRPILERVSKI